MSFFFRGPVHGPRFAEFPDCKTFCTDGLRYFNRPAFCGFEVKLADALVATYAGTKAWTLSEEWSCVGKTPLPDT